eukprot:TRINITY_DN2894_c0_g1_i3.p1 TRINITY_DN2894_c0_g1~~TRINITY_DN2894_c0_g1_i3.p1  ORF type:complete len:362 (+),score=56.31 TRINITY_DN2894_c0_g1_i3:79-1164(+)
MFFEDYVLRPKGCLLTCPMRSVFAPRDRTLQSQWCAPSLGCPGRPVVAALWCMRRLPGRIALFEDLFTVCMAFLRREWLVAWWDDPHPTRFETSAQVCFGEPMPLREAVQLTRAKADSGCRLFCRGGDLVPRPSTDGWRLAGQWTGRGRGWGRFECSGAAFLPYPKPLTPEVFAIGSQGNPSDPVEYEIMTAECGEESLWRAVERVLRRVPHHFRIFRRGGRYGSSWRTVALHYSYLGIPIEPPGGEEADELNPWKLSAGKAQQLDEEAEDVIAALGPTLGRWPAGEKATKDAFSSQDCCCVFCMTSGLQQQQKERAAEAAEAHRRAWRAASLHRALPHRRPPPRARAGTAARRGKAGLWR